MITEEELKSVLSYNPNSGNFIWLVSQGSVSPGRIAGSLGLGGYITIIIDRKQHKAHRLAWLYMMGEWLGSYLTPEEAHQVYLAKARELHGEFARSS